MKKHRSIIYVNYSPYENSGKTLDFLLNNFSHVFLISLGFYYLGTKQKSNLLTIYRRGKVERRYSLYQIPIPPKLVFFFLPLKSIINLLHLLFWGWRLRERYGPIDIFFSVNAYTAWVGNILKRLGFVKKTIFWVWDYYPPIHQSKIVTLMRAIYWQFDKWAIDSDRVVFVNQKLLNLRKAMGLIPQEATYPVVSIGTDRFRVDLAKKDTRTVVFGFIGVLKKSQGFGIVFDHAKEILREFPSARYEIIGSGPDEDYYRQKAKYSMIPTTFHGYIEGDTFNEILSRCTIGIATYVPDQSNVSHYGDPGKIKRYLSLGIPVIATDVFELSAEVRQARVGVIIDSHDDYAFIKAVRTIMRAYPTYAQNALNLAQKFYYKKIYLALFE